MNKIEVPVRKMEIPEERKVSRIDYEKYGVVLSENCIVFGLKSSKERYIVMIGDLIEKTINDMGGIKNANTM